VFRTSVVLTGLRLNWMPSCELGW